MFHAVISGVVSENINLASQSHHAFSPPPPISRMKSKVSPRTDPPFGFPLHHVTSNIVKVPVPRPVPRFVPEPGRSTETPFPSRAHQGPGSRPASSINANESITVTGPRAGAPSGCTRTIHAPQGRGPDRAAPTMAGHVSQRSIWPSEIFPWGRRSPKRVAKRTRGKKYSPSTSTRGNPTRCMTRSNPLEKRCCPVSSGRRALPRAICFALCGSRVATRQQQQLARFTCFTRAPHVSVTPPK
jgi:hypothetical protein